MCLELATLCLEQGHTTGVLTIVQQGALALRLPPQVHTYHLNRRNKWHLKPMRRFCQVARQYSLIHVYARHSLRWVLLAMRLGGLKKPVLLHDHHGLEKPYAMDRLMPLLKHKYTYAAVSQQLLMQASQLGVLPTKAFLLPNCLKLPTPNRASHTPGKPLKLLCISHFTPRKNVAFLLPLLKELQTLQPMELTIIGQIQDPAYYQSFIEQCRLLQLDHLVQVHTHVPNANDKLGQYDLALHPSLYESGPLVLLEYAAAGLPFIANPVGQVPKEWYGHIAQYFPPKLSLQTWVRYITGLLANPWHAQAQKLQNLFNTHCSPAQSYGKLMRIYSATLVNAGQSALAAPYASHPQEAQASAAVPSQAVGQAAGTTPTTTLHQQPNSPKAPPAPGPAPQVPIKKHPKAAPLVAMVISPNGLGHFRRCTRVALALLHQVPGMQVAIYACTWQWERMQQDSIIVALNKHPNLWRKDNLTAQALRWHTQEAAYFETGFLHWHQALQNQQWLQEATLVISDNLTEVLQYRPDTVMMGSFLWGPVLKQAYGHLPNVQQWVSHEEKLLSTYHPHMLCVQALAMPQLRQQTQAVGLPFFDLPRHTTRATPQAPIGVAFLGGATGSLNTTLLKVAARLPFVTATFMQSYWPAAQKNPAAGSQPFDFSNSAWQQIHLAIIRPGVGAITECVAWRVPMLLLVEGNNAEMKHNAQTVQAMGLGRYIEVPCTHEAVLGLVQDMLQPNAYQQYQHALEQCPMGGVEAAVEWLQENYL